MTRPCPDGCRHRRTNRQCHLLHQLGRKGLSQGPRVSATIQAYCPHLESSERISDFRFYGCPQRFTTTVHQDSMESLTCALGNQTENKESVGNSRGEYTLTFPGFLRLPAGPGSWPLLSHWSILNCPLLLSPFRPLSMSPC